MSDNCLELRISVRDPCTNDPSVQSLTSFCDFSEPFSGRARTSTSMTAIQEPPPPTDASRPTLASLRRTAPGRRVAIRAVLGGRPHARPTTSRRRRSWRSPGRVRRARRAANGRLLARGCPQPVAGTAAQAEPRDQHGRAGSGRQRVGRGRGAGWQPHRLPRCAPRLRGATRRPGTRRRSTCTTASRRAAKRSPTRLEMKPDGVKTLLRRTRQVLRECVERKLNSKPNHLIVGRHTKRRPQGRAFHADERDQPTKTTNPIDTIDDLHDRLDRSRADRSRRQRNTARLSSPNPAAADAPQPLDVSRIDGRSDHIALDAMVRAAIAAMLLVGVTVLLLINGLAMRHDSRAYATNCRRTDRLRPKQRISMTQRSSMRRREIVARSAAQTTMEPHPNTRRVASRRTIVRR